MVSAHRSYINTTRVSWCKRHTAEGNRGLSGGDTTALLKLCLDFSSLSSLASLLPQQNMGMQCSPWEGGIKEGCALHRKGRGRDLLVCYRYASLVTYFFPTIYSSHILVMRLGKIPVSQIWMHIPPAKSFTQCQDESLFLLCPRKPEPKVNKKDWFSQQVPLSEDLQ